MKYVRLLGVSLVLSLLVGGRALAGDAEDAQATVDKAISSFNSKDYAGFFSFLADNLEAYTGVETPLLHEGKAHWMEFINGLGKLPSVKYTQQQNSVRVFNGNAAVINGYYVFTVVGPDNKQTVQSGMSSTTLAKMGGKWQIGELPLFEHVLGPFARMCQVES